MSFGLAVIIALAISMTVLIVLILIAVASVKTEFDLNLDIEEQVDWVAWYNRQKEAKHEKEVEQSSNNGSY